MGERRLVSPQQDSPRAARRQQHTPASLWGTPSAPSGWGLGWEVGAGLRRPIPDSGALRPDRLSGHCPGIGSMTIRRASRALADRRLQGLPLGVATRLRLHARVLGRPLSRVASGRLPPGSLRLGEPSSIAVEAPAGHHPSSAAIRLGHPASAEPAALSGPRRGPPRTTSSLSGRRTLTPGRGRRREPLEVDGVGTDR